ncbi:hypothetical protein K490DRAFT_38484 [Saccharata proteae CBS 121410]|uniref:Pantetheine-phosphate adenylyltransferase family protein-like protein n=1 Tax=Saccharata proteae CBS 121410 TaxID=1314787 RepID=A0A6A5YBY2_9PEZI|nr:hypothetical protein K490DRAFT_38484 [Saccharata proteae CBS 121410]
MATSRRSSPRALLLLPPPPSPPSFEALKAAYGSSLFVVLREIQTSSSRSSEAAVLDIALPCPHLYGQEDTPRAALYPATQALVSGVYKLICVLAAQDAIDVEDAEGVDARILLVAYPRDGKLTQASSAAGRPHTDLEGPVVSIGTLARSRRSWETIYSVDSESGESLLQNFQKGSNSTYDIKKIRGGIVQVLKEKEDHTPASIHDTRRHFAVAVGGTFDHLHIGHKLLLTMTAFAVDIAGASEEAVERSITVGITGNELLTKKKYAEYLESWDVRQRAVSEFLESILVFAAPGTDMKKIDEQHNPGPNGHAVNITLPSKLILKCVEIWDPFGPTVTDESISALVLSGETRSGGQGVNSTRQEKGWPDLEVFEVDVLDAEAGKGPATERVGDAFQSKLSSTEIRRLQSEKRKPTSKA